MFELTVIFFRGQYKTRHNIKGKLKYGISIISSSLFLKSMPYYILKRVLFNWGSWGTQSESGLESLEA